MLFVRCAGMLFSAASSSWVFRRATCSRYLETCFECLRSFSPSVQLAAAEAINALLLHRIPPQHAQQEILSKLVELLEQQQQHVAARSGLLLALAALPPQVYRLELQHQQEQLKLQQQQEQQGQEEQQYPREHRQQQHRRQPLLQILLQEATALAPLGCQSLNDPFCRRNALIALAFLIESVSPAHALAADASPTTAAATQQEGATLEAAQAAAAAATIDWKAVVRCLYNCAADFSVDQRGDIGSWIREVAAEVAALILEAFPFCSDSRSPVLVGDTRVQPNLNQKEQKQQLQESFAGVGPNLEERQQLLLLLLRLSFEGLTRVRGRAAFLLSRLVAPTPVTVGSARRFKVQLKLSI